MLVRNLKGCTLAALPAFIVFIVLCALPGGFSYASLEEGDVATAEPAADEQPAAIEEEEPAAEATQGSRKYSRKIKNA